MIVVYTSPGCASCRKVKSWLKERDLKFIEKNIFTTSLNEAEIKYLLSRSENGTEDIISKRSKVIQETQLNIDEMSMNDLVKFIQANPSVLKRPIIINERSFLVGYDEEEIGAFIPAELRHLQADCSPECPDYAECAAKKAAAAVNHEESKAV